jgi:hypothetical protein
MLFKHYKHGSESKVVRTAHVAGVNNIADELVMKFGDLSLCLDDQHSGAWNTEGGDNTYAGEEGEGEGEGGSSNNTNELLFFEASDEAVDFRDRVEDVPPSSEQGGGQSKRQPRAQRSDRITGGTGTGVPAPVVGADGTLSKDLTAYFIQEHHKRQLSNLGFFERDNFLDFD